VRVPLATTLPRHRADDEVTALHHSIKLVARSAIMADRCSVSGFWLKA
jgi:hypothetical protein